MQLLWFRRKKSACWWVLLFQITKLQRSRKNSIGFCHNSDGHSKQFKLSFNFKPFYKKINVFRKAYFPSTCYFRILLSRFIMIYFIVCGNSIMQNQRFTKLYNGPHWNVHFHIYSQHIPWSEQLIILKAKSSISFDFWKRNPAGTISRLAAFHIF